MHWRLPLLASIFAIATIGATNPTTTNTEIIKVSKRHPFPVCAGVCPQYDLQVHADGRVETRRISFDGPDEYKLFRVRRERVARFMEILQPLHPSGDNDDYITDADCGPPAGPDSPPYRKELEIKWIDNLRSQRFLECSYTDRFETLDRALEALGLDVYASRNKREER